MISHRNFSMDIKKELLMTSPEAMETCEPLDLSRRHDSVETRSTPSPYSYTSSFGENSRTMHDRTETPIHQYSTPIPQQYYGISEALLQAVEFHWNILHSHTPTSESDESSESSSFNANINSCPMDVGDDVKLSRPFRVYRRECIESQSARNFSIFKKNKLDEMYASNGRQRTVSNPNMRRTSLGDKSDSSNARKDSAYYEKREKNNIASKISRDRRKMKETEIEIRIAYLEVENAQLENELERVKTQIGTFDASESSNTAQ